MTEMGDGRINPHFCTEEEIINALQIIEERIEDIEAGSVIDGFTVKITTNDTTPSFLHDAVEDNATYVAAEDLLVTSATVGASGTDQTERFFVDSSIITGYIATGTYALCLVDGVKTWVDTAGFGGAGSDAFTVKCTTNDTNASFLHDALNLNATYATDLDILVASATVNAGGNEKERLFVDMSTVSGYDSGGPYVLVVNSAQTSLLSPEDVFSGELDKVKCTNADTTASYLHSAFTTKATRDTSADPLIATETANPAGEETETLFLDFSEISGYNLSENDTRILVNKNGTTQLMTLEELLKELDGWVLGSNQVLGHAANGDPQWKTLTEQIINNPTDIQLTLTTNLLTSTLPYTPYTFLVWPAASGGTATTFSDTVPVDDC